jgi:hypothetical protein
MLQVFRKKWKCPIPYVTGFHCGPDPDSPADDDSAMFPFQVIQDCDLCLYVLELLYQKQAMLSMFQWETSQFNLGDFYH